MESDSRTKRRRKKRKEPRAHVSLVLTVAIEFNGAIRCICHSMTLLVNEAGEVCDFPVPLLTKINDIYNYIADRPKVSTSIVPEQCRTYTRDRIVRLP